MFSVMLPQKQLRYPPRRSAPCHRAVERLQGFSYAATATPPGAYATARCSRRRSPGGSAAIRIVRRAPYRYVVTVFAFSSSRHVPSTNTRAILRRFSQVPATAAALSLPSCPPTKLTATPLPNSAARSGESPAVLLPTRMHSTPPHRRLCMEYVAATEGFVLLKRRHAPQPRQIGMRCTCCRSEQHARFTTSRAETRCRADAERIGQAQRNRSRGGIGMGRSAGRAGMVRRKMR